MWLIVLEIGLSVALTAFFVTQVILPLGRGEPIFPLFWSKQMRLGVEEKRLRQLIHEHGLEDIVEALRQNLDGPISSGDGNGHGNNKKETIDESK